MQEMQETWVQVLGWEDPLEEGMATHSNTLAWRIPQTRGGWWATACVTESATTELTVLLNSFFSHVCNPGLSFLRNRR